MRLQIIETKTIKPNPLQPRASEREIDELAAAIEQVGLLDPVSVVVDGADFRLIDGHRRLAACKKLGQTEIQAIIVDPLTDAAQIESIMARFAQREDLTSVEFAMGVQSMLDLGIDEAAIIKTTGLKAADIKVASGITKATKQVTEDVRVTQASFEEAAALVEFEGDKDGYKQLVDNVGSGSFAHVHQRLSDERDRHAKVEAARAQLMAEGCRIEINRDWTGWATLKEAKTTPAKHKGCPGHCAIVSYHGGIEYFCSTPSEHGIKKTSSAKAQDKEAEKVKRQHRAAFRSATIVRLAFIKSLLQVKRSDLSTPAARFSCNYAWRHGLNTAGFQSGMSKLLEALGFGGAKVPTSPLNGIIALALMNFESRLEGHNKFSGMVVPMTSAGVSQMKAEQEVVLYFDMLGAHKYTLSDSEKEFVALCAAKATAEPVKVDPGKPLVEEVKAPQAQPEVEVVEPTP